MSHATLPSPATPAISPLGTSTLVARFDRLLDEASKRVNTHPWVVVIAMHEVFRNLYPADPFIPFDAGESHLDRIDRVIHECTAQLQSAAELPSYLQNGPIPCMPTASGISASCDRAGEPQTQKLYGALWDQFDTSVYIEEASRILRERFAATGFLDSIAPGSTLLDAGCGSGRYTMALARLTPARVIGLDLGATSLERARRIASDARIANVEFRAGNVLELPFADASIDCVFSNGVLHHTGDTIRGLREMHRVLKPGGRAFLYLYGAGGVFWHARRAAREVMQRIPREYTVDVLRMIGMPANRFIFADTWYVPIEDHIGCAELESALRDIGFTGLIKITSHRATDLDSAQVMTDTNFTTLWGDGEHRYLLTKHT